MKKLLLLLALTGCTGTPPAIEREPEQLPPVGPIVEPAPAPAPNVKVPANCAAILKKATAGCPAPGKYGAIDLVAKIDRGLAELAACSGIHTFMKYYDYQGERPWHETIKGKVPTAEEFAVLKEFGFSFAGVFQHNNNQAATFTAARGKEDATQALRLAAKWGQPGGTGIYFGVDGDFKPPIEYFRAAAATVRAGGYRIGMYGSGGNCKALKAAGLVDGNLCMIAASSWAWNGTKKILEEGAGFALKQKVDIRGSQVCLGKSLDYNEVMQPDFGQWRVQ